MPSKRSREWKRRKLAAEAAARLQGNHPPVDYSVPGLAEGLRGFVNGLGAGGTGRGKLTVQSADFSNLEMRVMSQMLDEPTTKGDSLDALAYSLYGLKQAREAAKRLDGTYEEPPVKWIQTDWDLLLPRPNDPTLPPRLDGRRRK